MLLQEPRRGNALFAELIELAFVVPLLVLLVGVVVLAPLADMLRSALVRNTVRKAQERPTVCYGRAVERPAGR